MKILTQKTNEFSMCVCYNTYLKNIDLNSLTILVLSTYAQKNFKMTAHAKNESMIMSISMNVGSLIIENEYL